MHRYWLSLTLLAACGAPPDPCDGIETACVTIGITGASGTVVDKLEFDIAYGKQHERVAITGADGAAAELPVITAIELAPTEAVTVQLVVVGIRGGAVVGGGFAESASLTNGGHTSVDIALQGFACTNGTRYCGGEVVPGAASHLYLCENGIPTLRGKCQFGCFTTGGGSTCAGGDMACTVGSNSYYCGGNEVDGDPQTRYLCDANHLPSQPMECPNRCVIAPQGSPDFCE